MIEMINLACICIVLLQKLSTVLAFSMIWLKSSDFLQVLDFTFDFHQVLDFFSIHHLKIIVFEICHTDEKKLISVSKCIRNLHLSDNRITDFHQVLDLLDSSSFNVHQVHDSNFQMIVFEICHIDEKFLIHANRYVSKWFDFKSNRSNRFRILISTQIESFFKKSNHWNFEPIRFLSDWNRLKSTKEYIQRRWNT